MANILALDLGEKRIGVARANDIARLAEPLTTLSNDDELISNLQTLIKEQEISILVIGLPRNLKGETTPQTEAIRQLAATLEKKLGLSVHWQDETLTSRQAEQELTDRRIRYNRAAIDALAACLILEDYLRNLSHPKHGEI